MTGDSSSTSNLSPFSQSSFSRSPVNSSLCSSPNSSSSEIDVTSFVPFLWEEKPGISKPEARKFGGQINGDYVLSSEKTDSTASTLLIPVADHSSLVPPLRPPPRLQKSSKVDPRHLKRDSKLSGARPNVLSQSLSRRRQHRRSKSEEDPFWLAMKVCTNEDTANFDLIHTGMKDQQSLDLLFSFKVPVDRENRSTKESMRACFLRSSNPKSGVETGEKQVREPQLLGKKLALPASHGKGGQVMGDAEVSWSSGEILNDVVGLKALQSSRNRLSRHSFDHEHEEFEPTVQGNGAKGICITVQANRSPPEPVELSCGQRMKLKQPSNKHFLSDLLGCKSSHLFFNSVIDPSIYRGDRVSSR